MAATEGSNILWAGLRRLARPICATVGRRRQYGISRNIVTLSRPPQRMDVLSRCARLVKPITCVPYPNSTPFVRTLVRFSKKGKMKTVKAVAKRFKITGNGKVKHWRSGRNHKHLNKSKRARRLKRKAVYCNKTQAKMIKKMLNR